MEGKQPNNTQLNQIKTLIRRGQFQEALRLVEQAQATQEEELGVNWKSIHASLLQTRDDQAARLISRIRSELRSGAWVEAQQSLEMLSKIRPDHPDSATLNSELAKARGASLTKGAIDEQGEDTAMMTDAEINRLQQKKRDYENEIMLLADNPALASRATRLRAEVEEINQRLAAAQITSAAPTPAAPAPDNRLSDGAQQTAIESRQVDQPSTRDDELWKDNDAPVDPTYRRCIELAQQAQRDQVWEKALEHVANARPFAHGQRQIMVLDQLSTDIKGQQQQSLDEANDRLVSAVLDEARTLAADDRYGEALEKISGALKQVRPARRREVETLRDDLLREKGQLIGRISREFEDNLARNELAEAENRFNDLNKIDRDWDGLKTARSRLIDAKNVQARKDRIVQLQTELDKLWTRGGEADLRRARQLAQDAESEFSDVPKFGQLKIEAEQKEREIVQRNEIWSTAMMGETFQEVLAGMLAEAPDKVLPEYRITSGIRDGRLVPVVERIGEVPREIAINTLHRQIEGFSDRKAQEYARQAAAIEDGNPRYAKRLLEEAREFYLLPDTRKNELSQTIARVEKKVTTREEVERVAQVALKESDLLKAWQKLQDAKKRDPHADRVEEAKASLRPLVAAEINTRLEDRKRGLQKGMQSWEEAEREAIRYRDLIVDDEPMAEVLSRTNALINTAVKLQALQGTVDKLKNSMDDLIKNDLAAAAQRLDSLKQQAGDDHTYFPEIAMWSDLIRARRDLHAALNEIEAGYRELTQEELEQRLDRLSKLRSQVGSSSEMEETKKRLDTRRLFLMGERFYRSGGSFRDQAEEYFKNIVAAGGEDAPRANAYLQEFQNLRAEANKAKRALDDAERLVERTGDHRQAILMLEPYREQPDIGAQVRERISAYQSSWQSNLTARLEVYRKNPRLTPLDTIETTLNDLKELAPKNGQEWEQTAMPDIYGAAASIAHDSGGASLSVALELWDKAIKLAPGRKDLQEKRQLTAKTQTRWQTERELIKPLEQRQQALAQAESYWLDYVQRYANDPEAYLQLADLARQRDQFEQALTYLRPAERLDQEQGGAWQPRIQQARLAAEKGRDIQQTKQKVESRLQLDKTAEDYKMAQNALVELGKRHPDQQAELEDWLDGRRRSLIGELTRTMDGLTEQSTQRWAIALKILILDPKNGPANRQVERAYEAVIEVERDTETFIKNLTGKLEVEDDAGQRKVIKPREALQAHIEQGERLRHRAIDLSALLDEQARNRGEAPQQQQSAKESLQKLNARIRELGALRRLIQQAQGQLNGVCARAFLNWPEISPEDPFGAVSNILGEIHNMNVPFANHLTVQALSQEVADLRQRRDQIREKLQALQGAVNAEDFDAAINLLNQTFELDRRNDFDVQQNVQLQDANSPEKVRLKSNHEDDDCLLKRLQARQEQWQRVETWQRPVSLTIEPGKGALPAGNKRLVWSQHGAAMIQEYWQRGEFKTVREMIKEAIGGPDSEAPRFENCWSLERCRIYLANPIGADGQPLQEVLQGRSALSERVRKIVKARNDALQQVETDILLLKGPRRDGKPPEMERLERNETDFYVYMDEIGRLLAQLQYRNWFGRSISAQERQDVCTQLREIIQKAKEIAPHYPGLESIIPQAKNECGA